MRLFWKVFLLLMLTLLLTAVATSWLSRQWLQENQAVEKRLNTLSEPGETAAGLYGMEGPQAYRRWLRHTMRLRHFRGMLLDEQGNHVLKRRFPERLNELRQRVISQQTRVTVIQPPFLSVARPVQFQGKIYYWIGSTMIPREQLQADRQQLRLMQLAFALFVIALVSWLLTRMFTRPIRMLDEHSKLLGQGDLDIRTSGELSERRDELGDLARSFDTMATQLDGLINSHKQLLRDISHELRSPLARLQVALELARSASEGKADAELNRIEKEAERLNELIGEVLTLARFEQGAVQIQSSNVQLDEIIHNIASDAAFEAEAMGKQVNFSDPDRCKIDADRLWIGQALDNVVRNAIRHTAANTSVDIALQCDNNRARITVRDHGPGVDESVLPHLFEPFFRASDARERHADANQSGYGLGLAISRRAIALHHGQITASNHPDGGLQVEIILPMNPEPLNAD